MGTQKRSIPQNWAEAEVSNNRSALVCIACIHGCSYMQHRLAGCLLSRQQELMLCGVALRRSTHKAGPNVGTHRTAWG